MKLYRSNWFKLLLLTALAASGCTKLNEIENNKLVIGSGGSSANAGTQLIAAYNDLNTVMHGQDEIFSLQENTTDECLVPTRAGDWDDNGVWRVLHAHAWDATHGQVQQVFSNLGILESDATTVLALSPTSEQAAEAVFLRSLAQYYFVNLFGQVPYRTVAGYNGINASPVMSPAAAIDTLVANLTGIIPQLTQTQNYYATADAARFLLMKVLLNKQAFLNPVHPAAQVAADMQEVYTLGQAIENSGMVINGKTLRLTPYYFDNFGPNNGGFGAAGTGNVSYENIFVYGNNGTATNPNGTGNGAIDDRWMMALHYNSWDQGGNYGSAGWNGFSTIADVYDAFDPTDTRKGNVPYPLGGANAHGVSPISGLNVGLDSGAQLNEAGVQEMDRRGNLLSFQGPVANTETNLQTLEGAGIRGIKYYPDYANYTSHASNQLAMFRLADVMLMMAEADLSGASGGQADALTIVNQLHSARGAAPLAAISLVNTGNLYDPTTILEERQKELWWESWRREDMIRMNVFLSAWNLKPADVGTTFILFPIPVAQLVANPNLKQNPGY